MSTSFQPDDEDLTEKVLYIKYRNKGGILLGGVAVEPDRPGDGVRRLPLHPRHHMRIPMQGELRRGMPKPLADHPDRHSGLDRDRGMSVPQIMEPDPGQIRVRPTSQTKACDRVRGWSGDPSRLVNTYPLSSQSP